MNSRGPTVKPTSTGISRSSGDELTPDVEREIPVWEATALGTSVVSGDNVTPDVTVVAGLVSEVKPSGISGSSGDDATADVEGEQGPESVTNRVLSPVVWSLLVSDDSDSSASYTLPIQDEILMVPTLKTQTVAPYQSCQTCLKQTLALQRLLSIESGEDVEMEDGDHSETM